MWLRLILTPYQDLYACTQAWKMTAPALSLPPARSSSISHHLTSQPLNYPAERWGRPQKQPGTEGATRWDVGRLRLGGTTRTLSSLPWLILKVKPYTVFPASTFIRECPPSQGLLDHFCHTIMSPTNPTFTMKWPWIIWAGVWGAEEWKEGWRET